MLLREETGLPVMVSENPQLAVVLGTGKALDELKLLKEVTIHASAVGGARPVTLTRRARALASSVQVVRDAACAAASCSLRANLKRPPST